MAISLFLFSRLKKRIDALFMPKLQRIEENADRNRGKFTGLHFERK